ncbi:MAG TPA: response regulator transcription factor [Steroidobacteraceae bacterium]|jgi:two-component system response regulator MprA
MRVLVVEDEPEMAELLRKGLAEENHSVALAADGRTGLDLAKAHDFDVIVLDLMLPHLDGYDVARRLRESGRVTPILILTARDSVPDIAKGLDMGADDYLTKPFSFVELLARLRAITRRSSQTPAAAICVADLQVDSVACQVSRAGKAIQLTATEFRLLEFLARRSGRVVSREAILEGVWGFDEEIGHNTVEAFISLLRSKIDREFEPKLLQTVRGFGYSLRGS